MKAHELLNNESKWHKGSCACERFRYSINASAIDAVKWSIDGAVYKLYEPRIAILKLDEIARHLSLGSIPQLYNWNDIATTKFEDVQKVLKELNI